MGLCMSREREKIPSYAIQRVIGIRSISPAGFRLFFSPSNKNMTSPLPTSCLCLSLSPVDRQTEGHFNSRGELSTEQKSLGHRKKMLCFAIPRSHIILMFMLHTALLEGLGFITCLLP